ncbi:MAG TPA: hypothetical protein VF306_20280 [Pirellulales bacterium]
MSTTKEVKALLEELRGKLEPDQAAYLEPMLRKILDAAKPRTVTEIHYRSDPKDEAEMKSLRATIASKDEAIRKLQAKLADRPPEPKATYPPRSPERLSREQRLDELDRRARAWGDWARECMLLMSKSDFDLRKRKQLLTMIVGPPCVVMCNYLSLMEGLHEQKTRAEMERLLPPIVNQSAVEWLNALEDLLSDAIDVDVDLELFLKGADPLPPDEFARRDVALLHALAGDEPADTD